MVGPLKRSSGGMTHLLASVDKFTKWIEAKPIKKLDGPTAVKFFKSIIYHFGYPNNIITDNGSNFVKGEFARFCGRTGIGLTSPPSLIRNQMDRSNEQMDSSWPASSLDYSSRLSEQPARG